MRVSEGMRMPLPIKVELEAHDTRWASYAADESKALVAVLGASLLEVHHIGSTAIPNIRAKPIVDMIPVVTSLSELDCRRGALEELGYEWWGELGLSGRRYCPKSDPGTGRRLVQLHCYAKGSSEITRHLAFRDYLRAHPHIAQAYEREKIRCQVLHPDDSHAYSDCKSPWIRKVEAEALSYFHR